MQNTQSGKQLYTQTTYKSSGLWRRQYLTR